MKTVSRTTRRPKNLPLARAVKIAGGQKALADALGRKQSSVWEWLFVSGRVSAGDAIEIEKVTGVPAEQITPELGLYAQLRGLDVRAAA